MNDYTASMWHISGRTYFFGKKLWTAEDNVGSAASGGTFWPWGEQRTGSSSEQYGFATYWEDSESSLNYAMNRYYSSTIGRFLTPDPYQANNGGPGDPKDPQSWNRYTFVENAPVDYGDPSGEAISDCVWSGGCGFNPTGGNYGGAVGGSSLAQITGPLATQEMADEARYLAYFAEIVITQAINVNVPKGNNYSPEQLAALQQGVSTAFELLGIPTCAGALAPSPPAGLENDPQSATDYAQSILNNTVYRLLPLAPGIGGATLGQNSVVINPNGAFFAVADANGNVTFTIPNPVDGLPVQETLPIAEFKAFIVLHELGHQTTVFGEDAGNNILEGQHSWAVLENCFGMDPP